MESQEERVYQRLVGLGMMPSTAARALRRAREMGDRLPTAADAWRDAEEDAGPVGQEASRQEFIYMALLRPGMRSYGRILESGAVGMDGMDGMDPMDEDGRRWVQRGTDKGEGGTG